MGLTRATLHAIVCFGCIGTAAAEVARIEIVRREPFAANRSFDGIGPYERLVGQVVFTVDPDHPANQAVVDLDLALRNENGRVEYRADLEILAPKNRAAANGTLLYDVNNRGRRMALDLFNTGADHFLMRQGYIVVWSGWIAEVLPGDERLQLFAPIAYNNDAPITGTVRAEMVPNEPADRLNISNRAYLGSYTPIGSASPTATLTWRRRESDPRVSIPPGQWRLDVRRIESAGRFSVLPQVELVLGGGFQPGYIYELTYSATGSVVQGLGLTGIRDLVSFLKHESSSANPLAVDSQPVARRAIGFGISQSGRCLRMLLYEGFNKDEADRKVFDGLIPHVAGAGLGFFNHRFASPSRYASQHTNHLFPCDLFPFTYGDETDPYTGRTDGLLRKARASDVVPKIMHVQTSAEYWHRSGSLVHTDALGRKDATLPDEVRLYAIGGAQHGPGDDVPAAPGFGQLVDNPTDYRPVLRALLVAMDRWIRDDAPPPPSRYPTIAEGTLVGWRQHQSGWSPTPGVRYPEVIQRPEYLDYGSEFRTHRRVTQHPPSRLGTYRVLVPRYGPDNNELGMLLLPSIAVPVATYTGWNLRSRSAGAENELLRLAGGYIPFARTADAQRSVGDPRPALAERYRNFEDYRSQCEEAARRLVNDGYLLKEDMERLVDRALARRPLFDP